jgi:hypothetical protein
MPIKHHDLFIRPDKDALLWRYTDLPKFISLITTDSLWLSNLETLARDDPYEGLLGSVRFPHRVINSINEIPEYHYEALMFQYKLDGGTEETLEAAFQHWYKRQEMMCILHEAQRRDYYINCWHESDSESVAMWKVYGSPGAGVAIISSCSRLESALQANEQNLFLGRVIYRDISAIEVGASNYFEHILSKLSNYSYEREMRLVYWSHGKSHAPLIKSRWNDVARRFEDVGDDLRPIQPGVSFNCKIDLMIEKVIISPYAPSWYVSTIEGVRNRLGYTFPVHKSILMDKPPIF